MKKGMSEMWWIISSAVIALVVVILILVFFGGASGKTFGELNNRIGGLGDADKDNVANTFDKCPCNPTIGEVLPEGQNCGEPIPGCKS